MDDWPVADIDHINLVKDDNCWNNLREASRSQNCANKNGHGAYGKGISKNKNGYHARLGFRYKRIYLGSFKTPDDAQAAYSVAARVLFREYARTQ